MEVTTSAVLNHASFKPTGSSSRWAALVRDETQSFDDRYFLSFLLPSENRELSEEVLQDKPRIHGRIDFDWAVLAGVNVIHFGIELRGGTPF